LRGLGRLVDVPEEVVESWRREDVEAREVRRRMADWDFINSQPARFKAALICYIEYGDLYLAARIAGLSIDEFDDLRWKANIPKSP